MTVHEEIFDRLSTGGTTAGARVYPTRLPKEPTMPAISYAIVSDTPAWTRDADDNAASGLDRYRAQLDLYASDATALAALFEEVRTLMSGYSGGSISRVFVDDYRESYADTLRLDRGILDLIVWYRR